MHGNFADPNKRCRECGSNSERYVQRKKSKSGEKTWSGTDSLCKPCRRKESGARRRVLKARCVEFLGGKCEDCGLVDIPEVYDFHHKDPAEKDFEIARKAQRSFETLKSELLKCSLLCANCHRKRHVGAMRLAHNLN